MTHVDPSKPAQIPGKYSVLLAGTVLAAILVSTAFAIYVLNRTLYSPGEFVRDYMLALVHNDVEYALDMPGVDVPADQRQLLKNGSLGKIRSVRVVKEESIPVVDTLPAHVRVTVSFKLNGERTSTSFLVSQRGTVAGLFPQWRFAQKVTAQLTVRVDHAGSFKSNGFDAVTQDTPFTVLTPGSYTLQHSSVLLSSEQRDVVLTGPTSKEQFVRLRATPNDTFVTLVTDEVHRVLDACASQEVLHPAGCPFESNTTERLTGLPSWSIEAYPDIALKSVENGLWRIVDATGTARLKATTVSLYDGRTEQLTEDVDYTVDWLVRIVNGEIVLEPQG